ncbi:hypothetical protein MGYG_01962 [Nannizzia gypsea CBS 118893]|uniref:HMA domain-containing protein n=1 Tax=Arthroderma gypseum (strain ATCC MYA-4604 / CBS 118893) TaxID=535722 RepID=E5QZ40_ARTGP|nr:hypothetical protein MGYG_01962 [Nannizzia gypsea CBS 118893]EFQ98949.1 hypothetical protein MGYG_01962 [Nannizzia gypsea CBS 118893]
MEEHTYVFHITMTCSGCSGAVERVLKKMSGVKSFDVSLENQTAQVVTSSLSYETVLEALKKTGKTITKGEDDGVERAV